MGRTIIYRLIVCGCGLFVLGLTLLISQPVTPVRAQDDADEAEYIGASECEDCHDNLARDHNRTPHGLALQEVNRRGDNILADFEQGADLRTVQFPGDDSARPFAAEDISLIVGAGRYVQRYVVELDDDFYAVFPAEWDTVAGEWRRYELDATWPSPAYDWLQNCAGCHTTGLNLERARWEDDGVQCEACHGPASLHYEAADDAGRRPDEEELAEIHGAIVVSPDPQICGQCHSQGLAADGTHPFATTYRPGGDLLSADVFSLVAEDDPNAWFATGHGRLNNMQFNEWFASGHARSLETMRASANVQDGCVTCHSGDYAFTERILDAYEDGDLSGPPPPATTADNAQIGVACVTCHSPHTAADEEFHLETDAYDLCVSCHRNTDLVAPLHHPVAEMFEGQPVIEGVDGVPSAHFSEEEGPRCVTCHMQSVLIGGVPLSNHTWSPVIPGAEADSPPDACSECHTDLVTSDLRSLIVDTQGSVRARLNILRARLGTVAIPEEGSEARSQYDLVVTALAFVQNDGSLGVHNYAYADALLDETGLLLSQLSVPGAQMVAPEVPAPTATPAAFEPIPVGMEHPVRTGVRPMTLILIITTVVTLLGGSLIIYLLGKRRTRQQETTP